MADHTERTPSEASPSPVNTPIVQVEGRNGVAVTEVHGAPHQADASCGQVPVTVPLSTTETETRDRSEPQGDTVTPSSSESTSPGNTDQREDLRRGREQLLHQDRTHAGRNEERLHWTGSPHEMEMAASDLPIMGRQRNGGIVTEVRQALMESRRREEEMERFQARRQRMELTMGRHGTGIHIGHRTWVTHRRGDGEPSYLETRELACRESRRCWEEESDTEAAPWRPRRGERGVVLD
ncbi:hypothetical protein ADEAN_000681700 [Angomonas deanei]|uniref:Uncharacterized protein n=1 Tax=Angomonas deanei TaxID=59799 RepID=A0A7G2CM27_9TRYP|nr:hypothetical protein ADEAN_000681700 [Angomonas deanei]